MLLPDGSTVQEIVAERAQHPIRKELRICTFLRPSVAPFKEFIEKTERRLRSFFTETPGATYAEELASRFKRFYLHATAQFLELRSESTHKVHNDHKTQPSDSGMPGNTGEKMVQVTSHKALFKPPDVLLSEFLLNRRRLKHNGNRSRNGEWEEKE